MQGHNLVSLVRLVLATPRSSTITEPQNSQQTFMSGKGLYITLCNGDIIFSSPGIISSQLKRRFWITVHNCLLIKEYFYICQ